MKDNFYQDPWVVRYIIAENKVDEQDANIIRELIKDSRQSTQSIANNVGLSRPSVHERIKKLEERGIIEQYTTNLNYVNCGLPLRSFILVGFEPNRAGELTQKEIAKRISREDFVTRVDIITGQFDFLVQIAIDFMDSLADVIIERLKSIPGVGNTQTLISFAEYQYGFQVTKRML